jgi:hypothetical protein
MGEAMGVMLGVDHLPVHLDVEDAAVTGLELGVDAEVLLEIGRQTGGAGKIVSLRAIGDPNVHASSAFPPVGAARPGGVAGGGARRAARRRGRDGPGLGSR